MDYRKEIDGLRAVAVIPVILFHAGYKIFSGGFIGVDVFFVISGYLITTIIFSDIRAGTFSLANFYLRRARRILPALYFVMFFCIPAGWILLLPGDLRDLSSSLISSSLFTSNIFFWRTQGYFSTNTSLIPLIHTWSLAVEEQYYLIYPVFVLMLFRFRCVWFSAVFFGLFIVSLALSQWGTIHTPVAAFYLLPTRGWELLVGALVAIVCLSRGYFFLFCQKYRELLGLVGITLVCCSIFFFDTRTPFPGYNALVPTIGAALIILCASRDTLIGKILSNRLLAGVGLISYSAYLWHQPLLAFARHSTITAPTQYVIVPVVFLTFVLAYISWRYVERPFRNVKLVDRKMIISVGIIGGFFFVLVGAIGYKFRGFDNRFQLPKEVLASIKYADRMDECWVPEYKKELPPKFCVAGTSNEQGIVDFVATGDSHAFAMLPALDSAAKHAGKSGIFAGAPGCLPFLGIDFPQNTDMRDCAVFNQRVFNYIKDKNIRKVILVGNWTAVTDGGYEGPSTIGHYISVSGTISNSQEDSRRAFALGLEKTLEAYRQIDVKVILLTQAPMQKAQAKNIYYRAYDENKSIFDSNLRLLSVTRDEHRKLQQYVDSLFFRARDANNLELVRLDEFLCDTEICRVGTIDNSSYFDDDHLSNQGAQLAEKTLEKVIAEPIELPLASFRNL